MSSEVEYALIIPLPELAELLAPWLEHSIGARPSHGIPPHVTVLFPCPNEPVGVSEALAQVKAFDVTFHELRRFPQGVVYLAPEPEDPFLALTTRVVTRFPDWLPFGGEFAEVVPHLTVAWGAKLDEAEQALAPELPLQARARTAVLLGQIEREQWEPVAHFPFGDV